jgi:NADPH-dependent 2,4-dienoyl-CoA reductase/sulfur reductase-like enzyme
MNFVIIGAGPAGLRAAETLRENATGAHITLLGGEPGLPYARMAIPYVLSGAIGEDGARQRRELSHLQGLGVHYLNRKALKVHAREDGGEVELDDGSTPALRPAAGGHRLLTVVPPPLPGTDLPGVLSCWTLDDARQIVEKLVPGARVVMLGAGFVAGVCMKSLVGRGVEAVGGGRALGPDPALDDDAAGQRHPAALAGGPWRGPSSPRAAACASSPGPRLVMDTRRRSKPT